MSMMNPTPGLLSLLRVWAHGCLDSNVGGQWMLTRLVFGGRFGGSRIC